MKVLIIGPSGYTPEQETIVAEAAKAGEKVIEIMFMDGRLPTLPDSATAAYKER